MTATIPPNHIVCPRCKGLAFEETQIKDVVPGGYCPRCYGEGHILNPLIEEWRTSTTPARLIELLGDKADEKRKQAFVESCRRIVCPSPFRQNIITEDVVQLWLEPVLISTETTCDIIRCLWPNPTIERDLIECNGVGCKWNEGLSGHAHGRSHCLTCNGVGTIETPIIDPGWISSTVLDLVKEIRGVVCERCEGTGMPYGADRTYNPPNKCPVCNGAKFKEPQRYELMPVLADALMDAGCDNEEVIEHCQSGGMHVTGCWVISEILKGVN